MNENIKRALVCLLNEKVIVTSWGINNISIKETSIEFDVCGFLYQGRVKVIPIKSGYRIIVCNDDFFDCSLDELVRTLDSKIEKSDNYEADLQDWLVRK